MEEIIFAEEDGRGNINLNGFDFGNTKQKVFLKKTIKLEDIKPLDLNNL